MAILPYNRLQPQRVTEGDIWCSEKCRKPLFFKGF